MEAATASVRFGELLREWRRRRHVTQLELSLDSNISARHLSFVETGRSQPSREIIVRIADTLGIPLRERNHMLLAAGYAPIYPESRLEGERMEPIRGALDRFLRAHEPYPALVIDRRHDLVASNDAAQELMEGVAEHLLAAPANAVRIALHPEGLAPRTLNLPEWSAHLIERVRREAALSGDPELDALWREASRYPGVQTHPAPAAGAEVAVPLRLADGERELAFLSTIATFGTALDVTLSELSIEAFYPANAATAMRLLEPLRD